MEVIVVGDIDRDEIERKIVDIFGDLANPEEAAEELLLLCRITKRPCIR